MSRFIKSEKMKPIILALIPVLSCLLYCVFQGRSIAEVYLPGSQWNDELFYFKQVEAIVNYGYPQGYFGFNESHALKLSFAAWSPVLVFPWILWGLLFGWNILSPIICNIVLLCVAMAIFGWLVRPTWKQIGVLVILFFLYTPFVRYMLSGMPEIICFAMLIVFYSVAISYLQKEHVGKLAVLLGMAEVMILMRPYLVLFMFLPIAFWVKRSDWKGVCGSLLLLGGGMTGYVLINHYLGAEYFTPLFFTDWIEAFFAQGFLGGIRYFCSKLYWNGLNFCDHMKSGIQSGLASGAFFCGYLVLLAVLTVQTIVDFLWWWKRRKAENLSEKETSEKQGRMKLLWVEGHLAFCFVGMLFALLLMYKLTEGSKHLLTFMAVAVFVVSLMRTKFYEKMLFVGVTFLYFYIYMAVDPYDYQVPFEEEELKVQVEAWEEVFRESMALEKDNVPGFENSVIWVFSDTVLETNQSMNMKWQLLYGLPEGMGISCCMPDYVMQKLEDLQSRYVATVSGGVIDELCREKGFSEVARDGDMVLYMNNR